MKDHLDVQIAYRRKGKMHIFECKNAEGKVLQFGYEKLKYQAPETVMMGFLWGC